jgi:hypothetical protein
MVQDGSDINMEKFFHTAVQALNPENKGWKIQRPPDSEEYFLENFKIEVGYDDDTSEAIFSDDPADFGFTWADLVAKNQELLVEYDSQEYARNRKAEYEALNQFEMQFDDKENGTTTWEDAIDAIKTKYPKG